MRKRMKGWKQRGVVLMAVFLTAVLACGLPVAARPSDVEEVQRTWDFSDGAQGWVYDDSWAGESYHGSGACEQDAEREMLKVSLDYSADMENGWSQTGISFTEGAGIDYSPYKVLSFDLYFDPEAYTTGQLTIKANSDNVFQDQMCSMNQGVVTDVDGLKMVNISLLCDANAANSEKPQTLMLIIIGNNTDYKGDIWFDNIKLSNIKEEKYLVDSTIEPKTQTVLTAGENEVSINGESFGYADTLQLVDANAEPSVIAAYQYLKAVGESNGTLFGHMEDTVLKAGGAVISDSDTEDVTGSLAAINGLDCGGLFSGFAAKYNERHEGAEILDTNAGNIEAAALLSNEAIERGAIITLSSHMPNFSGSRVKKGEFEHTYDGYDYSIADSYNLTGDCINQILPGGQYHEAFRAYLDFIADYAKQVNGPILFRPFHENTGSWFWWGKAFCDAETYKSVYKYTVEYLRDEKEVHNLLYLYGPGAEASTLEEYEERYPGDEYVDLVGFDTYDNEPVTDGEGYTFQTTFDELVRLTDEFAKKHGKLFAVTETGVASSGSALKETGNKRPEWFTEILDIVTKPEYDCCYFMLWSNYSRTGSYYTPFVEEVNEDGTLFGHELLDPFIEFYNNEKSIFAQDQKEIIAQMTKEDVQVPQMLTFDKASGYMTMPVSGQRVLEEMTFSARLNNAASAARIEFAVAGEGEEYRIAATVDNKNAEGVLDAQTLQKVGASADGKVRLYADGQLIQEFLVIFNISPPPEDSYVVDDFESYVGVTDMMLRSWSVNKDSGCTLDISLAPEYAYDGEYTLKFDYVETQNGWAGCEFLKTADWSGCNALQLWVVPDGKNQKTVVQINTSTGGSYEAYLQEYEEYASSAEPLLITLPFEEFKDKNGKGSLTSADAANVSGFGLWVNAIADSEAMEDGQVAGALYYDSIRAIHALELTGPVFEALYSGGIPEDVVTDTNMQTESKKNLVVPMVSGAVSIISLVCLIGLGMNLKRSRKDEKVD